MNKYLTLGLTFAAGAVAGVIGMKIYFDKNYEVQEVDDETVEVVEETTVEESPENTEVVEEKTFNNKDIRVDCSKIKSVEQEEYKQLLGELKYQSEKEAESILGEYHEHEKVERSDNEPYQISQDEFEDIDSYESDEYTYYADGYVTDSYGFPVSDEDVENSIGAQFDKYFEGDVDQIWIRNERLQMDFSIIRDLDNLEDVANPKVRKMLGLV